MSKQSLQEKQKLSYLSGGNAAYIEELYEHYLTNPSAIAPEWRQCFDHLPKVNGNESDISHEEIRDYFRSLAQKSPQFVVVPNVANIEQERKQSQVMQLIHAYRSHGHHHAQLDPLNLSKRLKVPDLDLHAHGLSDADLSRVFNTGNLMGPKQATLAEIIAHLERSYCRKLGIEYMHITNNEEVKWLQQQVEFVDYTQLYSIPEKKRILQMLIEAEGLEKYLGTKFVGQKRFSIEGSESLIPCLDHLIQTAGKREVKEIILGMAHRGRLNVLVNILGKSPSELFQEFEGKYVESARSGDVKYHLGFSSDVETTGGPVHLALAFNPSHLEIISPVVEGSVRAREERRHDLQRHQVLPVLIHGDAAFAGQGVVMETFNMSQARGFATGGSVHIIVNNQIGFTTSNPLDARSTLYCTDVAKMVQAPILHVNGDEPETVLFAIQLALEYRLKFHKDVVVDLVCYRRHGHNEADEPAATQPMMYQHIRNHPTTAQVYAGRLAEEEILNRADVKEMSDEYRSKLDRGDPIVMQISNSWNKFAVDWSPYFNIDWRHAAKTAVPMEHLKKLGEAITRLPKDFILQQQVQREMDLRNQMTKGEISIHWGYAETMAYATLLDEGYGVRLCGQDSARGTFAHRHAQLHEYHTGEIYTPLAYLSSEQGRFTVIDSILSEEAVLAFEYGYAMSEPKSLVIWEAQFGDFANNAQVVIDQFISSGEQKWGRLCGLVMLLPHGYEGMGPEHSSARLERYLQLCAQDNIQICLPTTAAQAFHMLRRQMIRPYRKPLIVMSPKSLLRHKLTASTLEELAKGEFQAVIPEIDSNIKVKKVKSIILCCGKVYYDLLAKREELKRTDVAIIRVEQLYPFPDEELKTEFSTYENAKKLIWCQEEPRNQGAWYFMRLRLEECMKHYQQLSYAGRSYSASPAVGSPYLHKRQQQELVESAMRLAEV